MTIAVFFIVVGIICMFVSAFLRSLKRVALFNLAWAFVLLGFFWNTIFH